MKKIIKKHEGKRLVLLESPKGDVLEARPQGLTEDQWKSFSEGLSVKKLVVRRGGRGDWVFNPSHAVPAIAVKTKPVFRSVAHPCYA